MDGSGARCIFLAGEADGTTRGVAPAGGAPIPKAYSRFHFPESALSSTGASCTGVPPPPGFDYLPTRNSSSSERFQRLHNLVNGGRSKRDNPATSPSVMSVPATGDLQVEVTLQWRQAETTVLDVGEHESLHARAALESGADISSIPKSISSVLA